MTLDNLLDKAKQLVKHLSFTSKRQQVFLEDLAILISDGVPANRAVEMLATIYSGVSREVALEINQGIAEGKPLAETMRRWFNVSSVELIRAGEEGGTLELTVASAAESLKEKSGAIGAIISALTYPLVVILAGCFIMVYLNHSIISDFADIKPINQWPSIGRALIVVADFIQFWGWLVVALVIASLFVIKYMMKNYVGELRRTLDALPIFSLYRQLTAGQLLETLGLLIANGVVFKTAVKVMQYHANPYLISHLIAIEHLLGSGRDNIAEVLNTGLVDKNDILRLRVIAEVKGFEHAMIRMGKHAAVEGNKSIRFIAKVTASVLLAVGGGIIVFMILAIYMVGMSLGTF